MNGIAEAVRQLRGTSVNQVPDVPHVLVTAGTGVPTSGLILSAWQPRFSAPWRPVRSAAAVSADDRMSRLML